ncbi:MAG: RNase adapter RapZ, partial [Gemmatimonadota bacterium]|nr:RNase adapter RapZ [Gemmatimonadota bacterium]
IGGPVQERILELFRDHFGVEPDAVLPMAGDGSSRRYRRLRAPGVGTVIGAHGPDAEENRAFLSFSSAFRTAGFPVPDIFVADEARGVWLEEDLGDTTLFGALEEARAAGEGFPESVLPAYERVVDWLPRFQLDGHRVVDYAVACPRGAFDEQSILWDLNYFKYHFCKLAGVPFHEARLEADFGRLCAFLLEADSDHFLYRDFQSRNVMLRDGEPWFLDYQGGRRGALAYDIASLLYDAKADLPETVRGRLLDRYLGRLAERDAVRPEEFLRHFPGFVLVRILQALGAYGYRGFFERKPHFLRSVPFAARNLEAILAGGLPVSLPELERVLSDIARRFAHRRPGPDPDPGRLTVTVVSFSYRRGYPDDVGGHGGGFVFDCRALPNPGREERYRACTGRDPEVAAYLERAEETRPFRERTRGLVEDQVRTYLERGFSSLTVAFGCTGGQHRSVFFAERLAGDLRRAFPEVEVRLHHREEPFWP